MSLAPVVRDNERVLMVTQHFDCATMSAPMKLIRYPDLVAKGVVNSRMTLKRLIDTQDFPPGVLITPNARAWDETAVDEWISSRPAARKRSTRNSARPDSTHVAA
jgi:predicted DNA-binding transcriptional regulator AlpA